MSEKADDEKLLVRYLLGDLSEDQRLQVEVMYLSDDQHYECLQALENELFYDYAQRKLSPDQRERFEERFLTSDVNRKRAMLASALSQKMVEAASVEIVEPGLAERVRRFKSYFSPQNTGKRVSLATLAIMLLVTIWLVIGIIRLQNELNRLRAERMVQEDRLQQQAQQERARADELNLRLKREQDQNGRLEQMFGEMQAQLLKQKLPSVISLVLSPSFIRDQAGKIKKVQIPPRARQLNIQLNLKGDIHYKSYQAILLTADGAERWSQDLLLAQQTASGRAIILKLPSDLLAEGDYELRVKGYAADGTLEETGDYYYFSVMGK